MSRTLESKLKLAYNGLIGIRDEDLTPTEAHQMRVAYLNVVRILARLKREREAQRQDRGHLDRELHLRNQFDPIYTQTVAICQAIKDQLDLTPYDPPRHNPPTPPEIRGVPQEPVRPKAPEGTAEAE